MRLSVMAASLYLGFMIAGCASVPNIEQEKEALLRVDREWAAVASEGKNVDRMLSFFGDDATMYPPGQPLIHGKPAIREFIVKSLAIPGFHITWHSDQVSLSADGTVAYATGENATTVPGPDGKLMTIPGRGITVWRRSSGGEWKCVVDIWNSGP
jgi:ketosteroid isomerase-like protein